VFILKDVTEIYLNEKFITELILETDEVKDSVRVVQVVPVGVNALGVSPENFLPGEVLLVDMNLNLSEELHHRARSWFASWRVRAEEAANRGYQEIHLVLNPI
jgi:hypothetical protein